MWLFAATTLLYILEAEVERKKAAITEMWRWGQWRLSPKFIFSSARVESLDSRNEGTPRGRGSMKKGIIRQSVMAALIPF